MPSPQTFYTVLALGKESAWGSPAYRSAWLPIEQPRMQPQGLRHVLDQGLRGQPALEYDLIPGPGEGSLQWQGNVYVDTLPHLLMAVLGSDTLGGTGPYTHTLRVAPIPPSYSLEWRQDVQTYLFSGARLGQLQLSFSARDGALTYQAQGQSKLAQAIAPSGDSGTATAGTTTTLTDSAKSWATDQWKNWQVRITAGAGAGQSRTITANTATALTVSPAWDTAPGSGSAYVLEPNWGTASAIAGWQGTVSIGGSTPAPLLEGQITFQRQLRLVHGLGATPTQDPVAIYPGPIQVTGRLTFEFSQATEYGYYLSAAENALAITFSQGAGAQLQVTMTKAGWRLVDIEVAENIYTAVAQISGIKNPTDQGPAAVVVTNQQGVAY